MELSEKDFFNRFSESIRMVRRSSDVYDSGEHAEAGRLATLICKIIGDRYNKEGKPKENSVSLSTRLGNKPARMIDLSLSVIMDDPSLHGPLCGMGFQLINAIGLAPIFDGPGPEPWLGKWVDFDQWWNATVVRDGSGNEFSRRLIIETMRDKEDAHTDSKLDSKYGALSYGASFSVHQVNPTPYFLLDLNPARVVVRQVAHELLRSFNIQFPPLFTPLQGARISPIPVCEILEKDEAGELRQVTDHKFVDFVSEITSTSAIWQEWRRFSPVKEFSAKSNFRRRDIAIRWGLVNYDAGAFEGVRMMFSAQNGLHSRVLVPPK